MTLLSYPWVVQSGVTALDNAELGQSACSTGSYFRWYFFFFFLTDCQFVLNWVVGEVLPVPLDIISIYLVWESNSTLFIFATPFIKTPFILKILRTPTFRQFLDFSRPTLSKACRAYRAPKTTVINVSRVNVSSVILPELGAVFEGSDQAWTP